MGFSIDIITRPQYDSGGRFGLLISMTGDIYPEEAKTADA